MSQTVPAAVQLGFAYAGATGIGYRVLRLDRSTVVVAFTTDGVVEAPANSGQFQVTGGHAAHDEGGYRVWGTVGTDILWSDIPPAASVSVSGGNTVGAIEFTYTVTNSSGGAPLEGVQVWITTDSAGNNVVWYGVTDAFGILRDGSSDKPFLDAGTYFFWRQKTGFTFSDNPDTETVSA